jgi:hypothetical protein
MSPAWCGPIRLAWHWIAAVSLLTGCAGAPTPDWQLNAKSALDRALTAHLLGNQRVESVEMSYVRSEIARTGRIDLLARAELAVCAAQVAALDFEPCARFEPLRGDVSAAERAYADYLAGRISAQDVAALPPAHRAISAAAVPTSAQVLAIEDPLARLVAAAVVLRTGRADPDIVAAAATTASAQGWRRPLLAWLKVQLELAEKAGAHERAERLRRRIAIVQGEQIVAPPPR